jgi:hypothetical protein
VCGHWIRIKAEEKKLSARLLPEEVIVTGGGGSHNFASSLCSEAREAQDHREQNPKVAGHGSWISLNYPFVLQDCLIIDDSSNTACIF